MARAISVRLDDEADRALRTLEATGLSQSEAIPRPCSPRSGTVVVIGRSLPRSPAWRLTRTIEKMFAVAELMEVLRAPG